MMKSKSKKIDISSIIIWMVAAIFFLIVIAIIVLQIYALINYAGKPADEIPGWVWWLWLQNRN